LAGEAQKYNWADINALSTMGAQQQQIGQAEQDYPLSNLKRESDLLRGYTVPTSVASTYQGPLPGAYGPSTLSTLSGIAALLNAQLPGSTSGGGSGGSTICGKIVDSLAKLLGESGSGSNTGGGTGGGTVTGGVTPDTGTANDWSNWWNRYGQDYNWSSGTSSNNTDSSSYWGR
jgi:hypothetical protein